MERMGDIIIFNPTEQTEFGVQPSAPVADVLQTTDIFMQVADRLQTKADTPVDSNNYQMIIEARQAAARAARFRIFTNKVIALCPNEIVDHLLSSLPDSDQQG